MEKKEWQKPKGNKEEKVEKRKREEEKEGNETRSKEDVRVVFLLRPLKNFVKGEIWSCGDLSWEDLLDKPEDLSDCEPVSCELVRVVLDVTDVPSSVVTEFCDVSSMCSDPEFVEPQCTLLYKYAGGGEVRRLTSESALAFNKKDDLCNIRTPPLRGSREVMKRKEEDGMREKEQSSQGRNSFWKEVTV